MANYSKHIVTGAFMADSKFPLDCETLAALQNNTQLMAVLGNIAAGAADKLILCGCSIEGNYRTEGYVWLRGSGSQLTGEILYHPRQYATQAYGWQVKSVTDSQDPDFPEARPVTVDGVPYPGAYSIRYIKDVMPGGSPWSEFTHAGGISNTSLKAAIQEESETRTIACGALSGRIDGLESSKQDAFCIAEDVYGDGGASLTGNTYAGKTITGCYALCTGASDAYFLYARQAGHTLTLCGFDTEFRPIMISATGSQSMKQALGVNSGWSAIRIQYLSII